MNNIKYGAFLARFQPLHNAHLAMIRKALEENDKVVIVLGSSNKSNMIRNPFSFEERLNMLRSSLTKEEMERIVIFELPDWSTESDIGNAKIWGRYLYYNMVSRTQNKYFTFYYSDSPDIIKNWFDDTEVEPFITYKISERSNLFDGLSATKIREAFEKGDFEYVKKYCPEIVYQEFEKYRDIWLYVLKNATEDFSM